jgi:hypothetical protein
MWISQREWCWDSIKSSQVKIPYGETSIKLGEMNNAIKTHGVHPFKGSKTFNRVMEKVSVHVKPK